MITALNQQLARFLGLACQAQSIKRISEGRYGILEMDREFVLQEIEREAKKVLNLEDEWEYRRLLEVYDLLNEELKKRLIKEGMKSGNPEVVEAANDFSHKLEQGGLRNRDKRDS